MGQEKTQRENGREQRNDKGCLEGGWASGSSSVVLCWPGVGKRNQGHQQQLAWQSEILGPQVQLPGSTKITTKLKAKPPLDQGCPLHLI